MRHRSMTNSDEFAASVSRRIVHTVLEIVIAYFIVILFKCEISTLAIAIILLVSSALCFLRCVFFGIPEAIKTCGTLYIDTTDDETDRYLMDFDDLDDLSKQKKVQIKIRTDRKLNTETHYVGE